MDKAHRLASGRPSCSLDKQQNFLAALPPQHAASGASSDGAGSAAAARVPSRTVATSSASFSAAAGGVIDVDAGDEDECSYYMLVPVLT